MPTEGLQWQEVFSHRIQWWDNRRTKPTHRHPDFRHKRFKGAPCADNRLNPAWVDLQLCTCVAGIKRPPELVADTIQGHGGFGRSAAHESHLEEVGICWKLCEGGRITDAVAALKLLVQRECHVPTYIFYRVLKRCIAHKDLVLTRQIHAFIIRSGYGADAFLATHLIGLYASHGRLEEAMQVFTKVSAPDAYNWATIIFAYARHGEAAQAVGLYKQMRESTVKPDNRIYVAVLKACAAARDLVAGKDVHAHIIASSEEPDIFVQTGLVDMYAKCGRLEEACRLFDSLPERTVVTWTAMMTGYTHHGMGQEALNLYNIMQQEGLEPPGSVTFVCLLQSCACVGEGALSQGKQLHAQIEGRGLQDDVVIGGSLVNMYAKCGSIQDARRVFDRLLDKNVVTWNAMLAGYTQQGMGHEALRLYNSMQQEGLTPPGSVTFVCLLQACAGLGVGGLGQGRQVHAQMEEQGLQDDVVLGGTLVNMYVKCGSLQDARSVFDRLPARNVVTWTAMLAGYAQEGCGEEALRLYSSMQQEGVTPPDSVTFVCLLQACALVPALPLGKQLHAQIVEQGLQADPVVGAALVHMYARCGSMSDSQWVFDSLTKRSIEAWGALTSGYTRQGDSEVVFHLFDRMRLEGVQPNGILFLNVLTACSHVGLVDEGRKYFEAMKTAYGISPTMEHYTCMMDLLGRAGHVGEALQMAKSMPFPPSHAVWLTLLGSCRTWNNVEPGPKALKFAWGGVDGSDAVSHALKGSNYASS